jgi:ActD protein
MAPADEVFGLMAEFDDPDLLIEAARRCRAEGYRRLDAYTPFPVEGLAEALGVRERALPYLALCAGAAGGLGGYLMLWWMNGVDFPLNVGGRPLNAWPAFAVPSFEMTILGAVLAVIFGMLALNRLPRLHHPVFNSDRFRRVTVDRFFLAVETGDPRFDFEDTRTMLEGLGALAVEAVPR